MSDISNYTKAEDLVERIVNLGSSLEALNIFRSNQKLLRDWKFILPSDKGIMPGLCVNRSFKNNAVVRSLFSSERVVVFDQKTISEMEKGKSEFAIDFSLSLDTMMFSYVENYIRDPSRADSIRISDVMQFIASPEVSIDAIPYLQENMHNLLYGSRFQKYKVYKNVLSYEIIRSIDKRHLTLTKEIRSIISRKQRRRNAIELISNNEKLYMQSNKEDDFRYSQKMMYCIIIKIVIIHMKYGHQTVAERMLKLMEFLDEEIGYITAREMLLAPEYFQRGHNLKFFGKIQKGREDIFSNLENMAWDMWHIRQCEKGISKRVSEPYRYFFSALLTQDNRFIEVIDICSLDAAIIKPNGTLQPVHSKNVFDTVFKDQPAYIVARARGFYSNGSRRKREMRRDGKLGKIIENYNTMSLRLEKDLSIICKIEQRQVIEPNHAICRFLDL